MSMNQKQLAGRTITVELSGRPPKDGRPPPRHGDSYDRGPPRYDDRSDQRGSFGGAGGGNSRAQASSDVATRNLFVGNIPPDATESDVMAHFGKYGDVAAVKFLPKKSDTFAAFVDFHNVEHARDAHDSSNMLGGMKLRTDYNQRKSASGPPPGGPSRGYDDEYDRGYDRAPPPPPRYDERPPPRYDDRYDDRRGGYDDRAPPPPRYDERPPPPRYDERPPPQYDDRTTTAVAVMTTVRRRVMTTVRLLRGTTRRHLLATRTAATTTVSPPSRERDYYGNDGGYDRGPPQRYDDRGYDDRGLPSAAMMTAGKLLFSHQCTCSHALLYSAFFTRLAPPLLAARIRGLSRPLTTTRKVELADKKMGQDAICVGSKQDIVMGQTM